MTQLGQDVAEYATNFLGVIGNPLLIVDAKLRVLWANRADFESFQNTREETLGSPLARVGSGQWDDPGLRSLLDGTIAAGGAFRDYKVQHAFPEIGERVIKVSGSRIPAMAGETVLILLAFEEEKPGNQ